MPLFTRSALVCAALWIVSFSWLLTGQADSHLAVYRTMLAMAIAATVVAAFDRHAAQLAEIAALSYRAGTAASLRGGWLVGGEMPSEPRGETT